MMKVVNACLLGGNPPWGCRLAQRTVSLAHLVSGTANLRGPADALRTSNTTMRPSPAVVSSWLSLSWQMPVATIM